MAKISDVQFSMNGEPKEPAQGTPHQQAEINVMRDIMHDRDSKLQKEKVHVFKLANSNKKGGVYVPHVCDAIHPETGNVERLRLLSGVPSPWQKDQKDVDPEYAKRNGRSLFFPRGVRMIQIPEFDQAALIYARNCSFNINSKYRKVGTQFDFFEYDPAKMEEERLKKETLAIDMAIEASKQPEDKMLKHASYLGIMLYTHEGFKKSPQGIRAEYQRYAHNYPEQFQKTLQSFTPVEVQWLVKRAINETLIDIGREQNKVYWGNNGGFICAIPQGESPLSYLTNLALTPSVDGKAFLDQLKTIVK